MHNLDSAISILVNNLANRWWVLDRLVEFLDFNDFVRGGIVLAILYFAWFQRKELENRTEIAKRHQILLYALLISMPGLVLTRIIADILPYRVRPLFALQLRQPIGFDSHYLLPWSSFPSDNAVLFFALATGVFLVGRKAGILLYLHAVVVVALPRLYLGIHYSSDLLAGALLGWALAYTAKWDGLRLAVTRPAFQLEEVSPGLFYGGLFLLSFETALLYTHVLNAAVRVLQFLRPLLHHAG